MGRSVRQKRKNRSGRSVVRQAKDKRIVNPTGNTIIAENWDKKLTLTQNYRRLGLMNRVGRSAGGKERLGAEAAASMQAVVSGKKLNKLTGKTATVTKPLDAFDVVGARTQKTAHVREVRVERDANGKIVRIVGEAAPAHNPLNDPLNDLEDEEEADAAAAATAEEWDGFEDDEEDEDGDAQKKTKTTPVVRALEALARQPTGPRFVRKMGSGQREWLQALADHYGTADPDEDTLGAMTRDRRRNAFQRSAGELRKLFAKFREDGGTVTVRAEGSQ